ncbi:hypothetical protein VNO77_20778 [Canavalia gladiata]|uniref:Uncharacterized protein n=1 Tax=Canavalia gladiata TaxID=3824 RepID=A0AAN9QLJ0_CANGL
MGDWDLICGICCLYVAKILLPETTITCQISMAMYWTPPSQGIFGHVDFLFLLFHIVSKDVSAQFCQMPGKDGYVFSLRK